MNQAVAGRLDLNRTNLRCRARYIFTDHKRHHWHESFSAEVTEKLNQEKTTNNYNGDP